jgi:hypothetical protein
MFIDALHAASIASGHAENDSLSFHPRITSELSGVHIVSDDNILKFSSRYFSHIKSKMSGVSRKAKRIKLMDKYPDELFLTIHEVIRDTTHLQDKLVNFAWERLPKKDSGKKPNIYFLTQKSLEDFQNKVKGFRLQDDDPKCQALIGYLESLQPFYSHDNKLFPVMREIANQKHTDEVPPDKVLQSTFMIDFTTPGEALNIKRLEIIGDRIVHFDGYYSDKVTGKIIRPLIANIKTQSILIFKEHDVDAIVLCNWGINTTRLIAERLNEILTGEKGA